MFNRITQNCTTENVKKGLGTTADIIGNLIPFAGKSLTTAMLIKNRDNYSNELNSAAANIDNEEAREKLEDIKSDLKDSFSEISNIENIALIIYYSYKYGEMIVKNNFLKNYSPTDRNIIIGLGVCGVVTGGFGLYESFFGRETQTKAGAGATLSTMGAFATGVGYANKTKPEVTSNERQRLINHP